MIGTIIWLTGIPSSGKTTIANILSERINAVVLDGDYLRAKYPEHRVLGYSNEDRAKNVLIAAEKAVSFAKTGRNVIVALVSPSEKIRQDARKMHIGPFVLAYLECPKEVCIERDPKGMWAKALKGEIKNFTGLDGPYEPPEKPDVHLRTDQMNIGECIDKIMIAYEQASRVLLYIGRWQPFHKGHEAIVKACINEGRNIIIAIRDTPQTSIDPLSFEERKRIIEAIYDGMPLVSVYPHPFPNIKSINIGRKVGYEIRTITVDEQTTQISGTQIREKMKQGDPTWKQQVPRA